MRLDFAVLGGPSGVGVTEAAAARVCHVWVWRRRGRWARSQASLWPRALVPSLPLSAASTLLFPHLNPLLPYSALAEELPGQAKARPAPLERWELCARLGSCHIIGTSHPACLARSKRSINIC